MFFWRKKESVSTGSDLQDNDLSINIESLLEELSSLKDDERYNALNQLGNYYDKNRDEDNAIKYYELYISESKKLGKVYGNLLMLYNKKRKKAAESQDEILLQFYLSKIDHLMILSKNSVRGL